MSRYAFIAACAEPWPVQPLCRVLGVSSAGYYQWRHAPRPALRHPPVAGRIAGRRPRGGALRPTHLAAPQGPARLERPPAPPPYHRGRPGRRGSGEPAARPAGPDRVWVGDITYLPLVGGRWCYQATWRDTCSRRVVGWHLAAQMPTELVLLALEQALTLRQPAPGPLSTPTGAANTPALPAAPASPRRAGCPASAGRVTPPTTMPRPKPAGARSKPNYCPAAAFLLRWKRPYWKWPTTSIPTSISTAATPPWATAPLINLNRT